MGWREWLPKGSRWYRRAKDEEDKVKAEIEARAKAVERRVRIIQRVAEERKHLA
jgi:hypothetical protein